MRPAKSRLKDEYTAFKLKLHDGYTQREYSPSIENQPKQKRHVKRREIQDFKLNTRPFCHKLENEIWSQAQCLVLTL